MKPGDIISEIAPFVAGGAICTVVCHDAESVVFVVDIRRDDDGGLVFGYENPLAVRALFEAKLVRAICIGGALVLRTFTDMRDIDADLPIKELRGWSIDNGGFHRVNPYDLRLAFATEAHTGAPLDRERAVVFPGPFT
jgi:hypothetical protein